MLASEAGAAAVAPAMPTPTAGPLLLAFPVVVVVVVALVGGSASIPEGGMFSSAERLSFTLLESFGDDDVEFGLLFP